MTIDEPTRHELFQWFTQNMPRPVAEAMMRSIPPTGWGDVATRQDLQAHSMILQGEMAEVRGEMAEVRGEMAEVRGEMAEVRSEMAEVRSEMTGLRGEIAGVRTELHGFEAETRGEFARLRGEIDVRFARTDRTIVIAAIATALSSWGASFAVVGF